MLVSEVYIVVQLEHDQLSVSPIIGVHTILSPLNSWNFIFRLCYLHSQQGS